MSGLEYRHTNLSWHGNQSLLVMLETGEAGLSATPVGVQVHPNKVVKVWTLRFQRAVMIAHT